MGPSYLFYEDMKRYSSSAFLFKNGGEAYKRLRGLRGEEGGETMLRMWNKRTNR